MVDLAAENVQTVGDWTPDTIPTSPRMADLEDWNLMIFAIGETIEDDKFTDADGNPSVGHLVHMIAHEPINGAIQFSDPEFPAVIWQTVMKRIVQRAHRRGNWTPFKVAKLEGGQGSLYVPIPVPRSELPQLVALTNEWMLREAGLDLDAPIVELRQIEPAQLTQVKQMAIESRGTEGLPPF